MNMKIIKICFLFLLSVLPVCYGQTNNSPFFNRFGGAPQEQSRSMSNNRQQQNRQNSVENISEESQSNQNRQNNNINQGKNQSTNNNTNTNTKTSFFPHYDPYVDNHLAAPKDKEENGLFGYSIFEVEKILVEAGARKYSYAFGKNSRMVLSRYMIVLNFDRNKKLGSVNIKALAPYKQVPPTAREYFMKLFLGECNLSSYTVKISSTELDISYKN